MKPLAPVTRTFTAAAAYPYCHLVSDLPARGPRVRELGLALPPEPMPMWRRGRLRKRWRYVGYYGRELMFCVGEARVGPIPQRWWAVAEPGADIRQRSSLGSAGVVMAGPCVRVDSGEVRIELELDESEGIEVASPVGDRGNYIWTRKQGAAPARGLVVLEGREHRVDGPVFVDESAGYHPRHTVWKWSAGTGVAADGRALAWNLVTGVHDSPEASERTLWVDGEPGELGPVEFADDLSAIDFTGGGRLSFSEWSARAERMNLLLLRSTYRQPFGSFEGALPGGLVLAEGYGVMEEHDVYW
jgi:hypothetical protein